jgi:hypothetical protein
MAAAAGSATSARPSATVRVREIRIDGLLRVVGREEGRGSAGRIERPSLAFSANHAGLRDVQGVCRIRAGTSCGFGGRESRGPGDHSIG